MASNDNKSLNTMIGLVLVVAVIVGGLLYFYGRPDKQDDKSVTLPTPIPQSADEQDEPEQPEAPVYEAPKPEPQEEPLSRLEESDNQVMKALGKLSADAVALTVPEEVIRKFVRAVNAVEEGKVVHEYRPIVSPAPPFIVQSRANSSEQTQYTLSAENYQRYDNYVAALTSIDSDALAAFYKRFYPLLEEAFAEMGLKKGNFHTVMLGAIDRVLAAPVIDDEVVLVRPKVFYQFADADMEKLPAVHKLMLRMGPDNSRKIQASLERLRIKLIQ